MAFYRCGSGNESGGGSLIPEGKLFMFAPGGSGILDESGYASTLKTITFNASIQNSRYFLLGPKTQFSKLTLRLSRADSDIRGFIFKIKDGATTVVDSLDPITTTDQTLDFSQALSDCDGIEVWIASNRPLSQTTCFYTFE